MMKLRRAIEIIDTEITCVKRNECNMCDRKCENCDLVLPTEDVLTALRKARNALAYIGNLRFEDHGKIKTFEEYYES